MIYISPYKYFIIVLMLVNFVFSTGNKTSITSSVVLKVNDKNQTREYLIKATEALGGYFLSFSENNIVLKIKNKHIDSVFTICNNLGFVVTRNYEAIDHSITIIQKQARLSAKRKLLKDYFEMLKQAEMGSVLIVERSIVELQTEIESLMADLKHLHYKIAHAEITVNFKFKDRKAPLQTGLSKFEWLNSLNLSDLRRDFQYGLR